MRGNYKEVLSRSRVKRLVLQLGFDAARTRLILEIGNTALVDQKLTKMKTQGAI